MFTPAYNQFGNRYDPNNLFGNGQGQTIQTQTIQTIQPLQTQVVCYFVSSPKDLENVQLTPNVVYIGFNTTTKEIYRRCINNNGIIEFETYKAGEPPKVYDAEFKVLNDKLESIEAKLGGRNERNERSVKPDSVKRNDG